MNINSPVSFPSTPFMRAFAAGVTANVPIAITGPPGQAKTATLENSTSSWGRHVETIMGNSREASDFLGIMTDGEEGIEYKPFAWVKRLNEADSALMLLDEMNTAERSTMKAMMRPIQERYVGDVKLNDSVSIVALMNSVETSMDGTELSAPLANRMMHLDWVFDADFWLDNVGTGFASAKHPKLESLLAGDPTLNRAAVSASITAFLRHAPHHLAPPVPRNPVAAGGAWPSPRSWTNAIDTLSRLDRRDEEARFLVLRGCVGDGPTAEYVTWMETQDLYDLGAVLKDPSVVDWRGDRPDRLYALVHGITNLGLTRPDDWKAAVKALAVCAASGKPDIAMNGAERLLTNRPAGVQTIPAAAKKAFAELLERTRHSVTLAA